MKFTKFIPVALALTLAVPAFAATTDTKTANFQLTIPQFFEIVEGAQNLDGGEATIGDGYSSLTLTGSPISAAYTVTTNVKNKVFYVKATVDTTAGTDASKGFVGDKGAQKIIFTNSEDLPAPAAISNIMDSSKDNANAIAFSFTPSVTSGTIADSGITVTNNELVYTVNPGTYGLSYVVGQTAETNSFSTLDNPGVYKCKLTITDVPTTP